MPGADQASATGSVKLILAPPPTRFSAHIRPPWCSTSPRAIASPRPAPPVRRWRASSSRQNRSNMRCSASGVSPVPRVLDGHDDLRSIGRRMGKHGDGPVRRRVAQRVGEQIQENPLDVARGTSDVGQPVVDTSLEAHAPRQRFGLQPSQAVVDDRVQRRLAVRCDRVRVELRQFEQIVHQGRHRPNLVVYRRDIVLRRDESVVDRLEHRLQGGERSAEVVAGPGHQLPAGVEQPLEACGHLVDSGGEVGELGRRGCGCPEVEAAGGESEGSRSKVGDPTGDRSSEQQRADDSRA